MRYNINVQNLQLQVRLPDESDTETLDKIVEEFNEHLMTFNDGKSLELYPTKEIKLLILTMISFIFGMTEKQKKEAALLKKTPTAPASSTAVRNSPIEDPAVNAAIQRLIALCDSGLHKADE